MDLAFKTLVDYVSRESGINLHQYRESYLRRRIELRMKMLGMKDYGEYLRLLKSNGKEEVEKLINTITINVTEFMRDRTPFEFLMKEVLPEIAAKKSRVNSRVVRAWSAGCSCGEEPYSIAISILETLGEGWLISIYATDIDDACLEMAREGFYKPTQLKNLSKALIAKYFDKEDDGYRVKSFLKKIVRFKKHDLTTEEPISRFLDIVFCRNVMIYFSEQQKAKVVNDFYNALVDGGYLVIGRSETLPPGFKDRFECVNLREKVYRKVRLK
ncbi:Methylase of chemotaxis methyl-accepting protein [Archaeoglobus fulgidus DSM 8774]|uniref:protein-glutamate O-methyltransferase n=1 Tax=Archaeoglobus fulgidus DSM 8774 TaxID=1344584 RepID=A0A075WD27_ARCFL|nr:protein-glutamate O-methyltransferase [Archaeoglobus fulgidus]AIG97916.1 Methylase of chemotaxis methyl-accepting protein [Archaeoglobus fulgidus DSM 8774]